MTARIGYLVPAFPGQTHAFFWREVAALTELGVEGDIVSTRKPDSALIIHTWAQEAISRTEYLFPPRLREILGGLAALLRAGPLRWWQCLRSVALGEGSLAARLRRLLLLLPAGQLAWLARRRGWTHLHVHSCANSADLALFTRLLTGLPYSLTLHGALKDYGPNQRQKWSRASFAIVITRDLLQEVQRRLSASLPEQVEVAPMGVDLRRFARSTPYRPWSGSGACRIFSCGRLNPCKAHDDLIRAFAFLRESGIPAELRIAGQDDSGTGRYRDYLIGLAAELGVAQHVHFLGAVSEETIRGELENAHVFALASRQEALGVAIAEAMALELPVVVTRVGGVPELVEEGAEGLLTPSGEPDSLARNLRRVLLDQGLAVRLGVGGREKVRRSFHSGVSALVLAQHVSTRPIGSVHAPTADR